MLELRNITKVYQTEGLKQRALDSVSLSFRPSEFVSILGPSGSGKTTLLNIIGGLDRYDSGDLRINEVSTRDFRDRDWDSYRNHRVGFVFQSYNLIAHQTVLANVELALTLSGIGKRERTRRAKKALADVGLEKHINKKPAQLSGGQMQRVAIARALINDPDILLADEPTGALDSETSEQIMKLLKQVSKNKLVIMVTHNPELASKYSTRIVKLQDGKIISDSKPYDGAQDTREALEIEQKKSKKTSMSLGTALSLSFNNLRTKLGRTILTAFAGSIGIIGIALILSLSNGIQNYISRTEEEALSNYPVQIKRQAVNMSSVMTSFMGLTGERDHPDGRIYSSNVMGTLFEAMQDEMGTSNDLAALREHIEATPAFSENSLGIIYGYDVPISIYSKDGSMRVNPETTMETVGLEGIASAYGSMMNMNVFVELADDIDGPLHEVLTRQYNLVTGTWPSKWNEVVIAVNENMEISDYTLYSMGLLEQKELRSKFLQMFNGETVEFPTVSYTPSELLGKKYKLAIPSRDWRPDDMSAIYGSEVVPLADAASVEELTVVGVVRFTSEGMMMGGVGYTPALTEHVAVAMGKDLSDPDSVSIYPRDFDAKNEIIALLNQYNETLPEDKQLSYTDTVGMLMDSVSAIVNVISSVLIAFVAISLIVSSIMIAIITYVSVLERTKEIGILRAIGARKRDISRVFNAETLIEGLAAGLLGIGVTLILCIPANAIIKSALDVDNIASLPATGAVILIIISVLLTVIAGLIPAKIASRKDPVEALRSE